MRSLSRRGGGGARGLDLSGTHLESLPRRIGQLTQLTSLKLSWNKLAALPIEIGQLTRLTSLDLSGNQLAALPAEIGQLTQLTSLRLSWNQLAALPAEIGRLTKLNYLGLSANQLAALPAEIGQLLQLMFLHLNGNRLAALPAELGQLTQLASLDLSDNRLAALPAEIGRLTQLTSLDLGANRLAALPTEIGQLTRLTSLRLSDNQLAALPVELKSLALLDLLGVRNNPLPIPPEVIERTDDPAAILTYYFERARAEKRLPLNEAKMVVIGQGGAGKTSLVKRLIHGDFDGKQGKTEGVDIHDWAVESGGRVINLHVWDFGGQEIYHATHQFFFTRRTLYVLVLDSRRGENDGRVEYWLKLIESFGGASPVIVVCNWSDEHVMDLDWAGLEHRHPNIRAFARRVSCKTGDGIGGVRDLIQKEAIRLEHIGDELPAAWFAVKAELAGMDRDFVTSEEYREICDRYGVTGDACRVLLGLLHDLGTVVSFRDDKRLRDTDVLNPEWVTKGAYAILTADEFRDAGGIFGIGQLAAILDPERYPTARHHYLVDLMERFELAFPMPDTNREQFLVPDLLPRQQNYTGEWEESLGFQYHYEVLPQSVVTRFIVRMHDKARMNTRWRTGVVLERGDNLALVRGDVENRRIEVFVKGNEPTRREFLGIIRYEFERIHASFSALVVEEKIVLPGHPDVTIDCKELLAYESEGIDEYFVAKLRQKVGVRELLSGYRTAPPAPRHDEARDSSVAAPERPVEGPPEPSHELDGVPSEEQSTAPAEHPGEAQPPSVSWWPAFVFAGIFLIISVLAWLAGDPATANQRVLQAAGTGLVVATVASLLVALFAGILEGKEFNKALKTAVNPLSWFRRG